ncbi:unnamed protein product, partial [Symbiodinium necroappetens]
GKKDNAAEKEPEDTLNQNLKRLGQCRMQAFQLENQVINECLRRVADLQERLSAAESRVTELQEELATARSAAAPRQADTSGAYDAKKPPCFRTANQDIVGSVQAGYLSIQNGAVIVATHIQDDYYFGYQFTQPTNQGWFKAAQTRDFDRREFSEAQETLFKQFLGGANPTRRLGAAKEVVNGPSRVEDLPWWRYNRALALWYCEWLDTYYDSGDGAFFWRDELTQAFGEADMAEVKEAAERMRLELPREGPDAGVLE